MLIIINNRFRLLNKYIKIKNLISNLALSLTLVCFIVACSDSDNNDGTGDPQVIVSDPSLFEDSLVLAVPLFGFNAYLLDKAGIRVHEFSFIDPLGTDLEILPDGKLLGMFRVVDPVTTIGGYGGIIRILNIDGSVNWEFIHSSDTFISHHDVEMLPNGNILFLAWERITPAEAAAVGVITDVNLFPDVLVEVDRDTRQIVWEWHSFDHIAQDNDPSIASTFKSISDNPQLIDFNYKNNPLISGNITHANGIAYDAARDVIYISINEYGEVWVIDHSADQDEIRTDSGGNFNKGGNLIYRFGNPSTYQNSEGDRLFHRNHHPNLIKDGLRGAGNMLIYGNRTNNNAQSTVYELEMPTTFSLLPNTNNEPNIVWTFTAPNLFADIAGSATRLSNGNTLIAEQDFGFWEVTEDKEVVWQYFGGGRETYWRGVPYERDSDAIQSLNTL